MMSLLPKLVVLLLILGVSGEHLDARHAHKRRQVAVTPIARADPTIPPLSSISLGMSTQPTPTFTVSYPAGAKPLISGAPPLPTSLSRVGWPPEDKVPDTNSPQVQAWMKELEGVNIPNISPTKDGTCAGDPAAAAQAASRGWWTCGGYTRSTDIVACPTKLDWGLTFDDGPSPYTPLVFDLVFQTPNLTGFSRRLLQKLDATNTKASFYVIGSRVIERPNVLIAEYMSGHEISVHTWSHPSLTSLTNEQIVAELGWTRRAIKMAIGVTPTTMRPPKGDIDDRVRAISLAMGLVPVLWTSTPDGGKFDSFDWKVAGGQVTAPDSYQVFQDIMKNATTISTGFVTLQHDLFEVTVDLAVGYTLDAALSHVPKFSLQPVGQCAKLNKTNLYRETNTNTTFPGTHADIDGDGKIDAAIAIGIPKGCTLTAFATVILAGFFL